MDNKKLVRLIDKAVANSYHLKDDEFVIIRLPRDATPDEAHALKDAIQSLPDETAYHFLIWRYFHLSTMTRDELLDLRGAIEVALGEMG